MEQTSNIISKNVSRDHTEKLLKYLKYPINIKLKKTNKIKNISIIGKQKLEAINNYRIPSDPSSAAFLIVLSTLSENSNLTIRNVLINKLYIYFMNKKFSHTYNAGNWVGLGTAKGAIIFYFN